MSNVNNVLMAYQALPNDSGTLMVDRPSNLRGLIVCPSTTGQPATTTIELRDGLVGATVLLKFDIGQASIPGESVRFWTLPDNGIRFDVGIFVKGEATNIVTSITVFYQ